MASGKNFRHEKRVPTFYVMITVVVFIAFCLIGAWVLSSSSESQPVEESKVAGAEVKRNVKPVASDDINEIFEDSSGDLTLENEEKAEETPQQQLEKETPQQESERKVPSESFTELKVEEPSVTKPSKNPVKKRKEKKEEEKVIEEANNFDPEDGTSADETSKPGKGTELGSGEEQAELLSETKVNADSWDTQVSESRTEKELEEDKKTEDQSLEDDSDSDEVIKPSEKNKEKKVSQDASGIKQKNNVEWALCDSGIDYIPCLDNLKAIKALHSTKHYEHRERHCPDPAPTCLVPIPDGYQTPMRWPRSRNEVWYKNVPHPGLVSYKADQNWVKKSNDRLIFPGGGTQFKHGALHYIDYVEESFQKIAWGKRTRVILDVGCGVASFGGYIFDRDVLTMSFAPKDEHEAQVQLALERGIPAISSVMGTQRLVFPSNVYDAVHCARCRVPWHIEGGKLLLELNRVLRPGGYFVWSATPVYWKGDEDVQIWKSMTALTTAMCWKRVAKFFDQSTGIGAAIFQKPTSNDCYENRKKDFPPMCDEDDKADAAWYAPMTACIHKIPDEDSHGTEWPLKWPSRLTKAPAWLSNQKGIYGKTAAADFQADTKNWERAVQKTYLQGLGIEWKNIRNVMDMRAVYGGFAAALASQPVWVMNVVPTDGADTLPVIFDRGLLGIYHDWCESFSSYPRTYDLLHADHLFSRMKKRCGIKVIIAEMDRLLRPGGWAIVRDKSESVSEVQGLFESLQWKIRMTFSKGSEGLVAVQKTLWRPEATF